MSGCHASDPGWILVVDDDEDIRDVLVFLLQRAGYESCSAADGLLALSAIRMRGRPALVLLDLRMPNMSGAELISALRGDAALQSVPVVVLSGDLVAMEEVESLGVSGFLKKPFALADVVGAVSRVLGPPPSPSRGARMVGHPAA